MTARTPEQVLTAAASTLVGHHDVTDALAHLVLDCADVIDAGAVALVVRADDGRLELLAATSHRMAELEIFQVTHDEGPCVDAVRDGAAVSLDGEDAIEARWPVVGPVIIDAGFGSVHAFPLQWHGHVFGGLNVFSAAGTTMGEPERRLGQAVADVATLLIVQQQEVSPAVVAERVREILRGRVVVERAKGVVAYTQGVDMARAYDIILETSAMTGHSLTETAQRLVDETRTRRHVPGEDPDHGA